MPIQDRTPSFNPQGVSRLVCTVTAYIDLLGLSNALTTLDRVPREQLSQEAALPIIQDSIGAVIRFRKVMEEILLSFREAAANQTPDGFDKDVWVSCGSSETRLFWFSDCGLLNIIFDPNNIPGTCRDIFDLLFGLATCTLELAAAGQLFRGGIEIGCALASDREEVLGSGLPAAFALEKRAKFPRIALGSEFVSFLATCRNGLHMKALGCTPPQVEFIRQSMVLIDDLIVRDADGIIRINFMSRRFLDVATEHAPGIITRARDRIRIECDKHRAGDEAIFAKYEWMLSVLEARPPL